MKERRLPKEMKNVAGVMIGMGLGFATMKDGEVLRKPDGSPLYSSWSLPYKSGLDPEGKITEDFVSGRGISARCKKSGIDAKEIERLAKLGDADAIRVWADTGQILAEVISLKKITRSERLEVSHMLGAAHDCFSRL